MSLPRCMGRTALVRDEGNQAPIFADAMWRSGSTYLASRFAATGRYMLFYEPCHEGVGRRPSAARDRDRSRDRKLRHPDLEGGYFGAYEQRDPLTRKTLSALHAPDTSLRSVFNEGSDSAAAFYGALDRVARAQGKVAFLGFCRSGTQTGRAQEALGARGLHLWRDPREQFASYGWPDNDYFLTGTALQLGYSRQYGPLARSLAPTLYAAARMKLAALLPDRYARQQYRLARSVAADLAVEQAYAVFYLSWLISYRAGATQHVLSFSLTNLAEYADQRARVEEAFGIDFADLRPTPSHVRPDIDYDSFEAEVTRRLDALTARPVNADE